MFTVATLKQGTFSLPQEFLDVLPESCPYCSSDMLVNEALTELVCINTRCRSKVVQRMMAIAKDLGILGLGESLATKFVNAYRLTNPLNLLDASPDLQLAKMSAAFMTVAQQVEKLKDQTFTLGEYVKLANVPHLRTHALRLLSGYSDLSKFYEDMENGGIAFVQDRLGIREGSISIRSKNIYETLMEFKEDLFEGLELVNVQNLDSVQTLTVCISDSAGEPFLSKKDFMNQVHAIPGFHVTFVDSVNKNIDALIWGGGRHTSKVKRVESYGGLVPIYSGVEFIDRMNRGDI